MYREAGELLRAADRYRAALEINERIGSRHKQVLDLMNLGVVHAEVGRLASAARLFERAETLGRDADSPVTADMVAQCRGLAARYLGDLAAADRHLTAALAVFREINDVSGQAGVLDVVAGVHADAARRRQARDAAAESLRHARRAGSRNIEAMALNTLGMV